MDFIHRAYFYGIRQMGVHDGSLIEQIMPTLIAVTTTAIHHCLSAWRLGKFRVVPEFGPGGGAHHVCNTRNINHTVDTARTDVFNHLDTDFHSSLPEVQGKMIDNIGSMICRRIHSTRMDPAMAQPYDDQGSSHQDFLDNFLS